MRPTGTSREGHDGALEKRQRDLGVKINALNKSLIAHTEKISLVATSSKAPLHSREGILNGLTHVYKLAHNTKHTLDSFDHKIEVRRQEVERIQGARTMAASRHLSNAKPMSARSKRAQVWRALVDLVDTQGVITTSVENSMQNSIESKAENKDGVIEELIEDHTFLELLKTRHSSGEANQGSGKAMTVDKTSIVFDSKPLMQHKIIPESGKHIPPSGLQQNITLAKSTQPPIPSAAPTAFGAKPDAKKSAQPPIPSAAPTAFGAKPDAKKSAQLPSTAAPTAFRGQA